MEEGQALKYKISVGEFGFVSTLFDPAPLSTVPVSVPVSKNIKKVQGRLPERLRDLPIASSPCWDPIMKIFASLMIVEMKCSFA